MTQNSLLFSSEIFSQTQTKVFDNQKQKQILFASVLSISNQSSEAWSCELTKHNFNITNKDIKSKKIGFRISKDEVTSTQDFFCKDISLLSQWIQNLNKVINQLGFHQQYKAIRKLGKGQFATVFEVEHLQTGKRFAVKAFSKGQLVKTPKGKEALLNEIKILRSFSHENLQKVECIFESNNSIYLITELLKGGSLFQRLEKIFKSRGVLQHQQIREFMSGIFSGLNLLNQKRIAHRDLKLDNIMLRSMESFEPVIIDFGLATFVDDQQYLYYRCGTPGYVSPQVMNSTKNQKVEPVSDLFSIGSIFHHLLTSKPLFEGQTSEEVFKKNKAFMIDTSSSLYQNLDFEALNLLKDLLELDPKIRISPNEALMSEYLSCACKSDSPVTTVAYETAKEFGQYINF